MTETFWLTQVQKEFLKVESLTHCFMDPRRKLLQEVILWEKLLKYCIQEKVRTFKKQTETNASNNQFCRVSYWMKISTAIKFTIRTRSQKITEIYSKCFFLRPQWIVWLRNCNNCREPIKEIITLKAEMKMFQVTILGAW